MTVLAERLSHMLVAPSVVCVAVQALIRLNGHWMSLSEPYLTAVYARGLDLLCTAAFVVSFLMGAVSPTSSTWFYARVFPLRHERSSLLGEVSFDPCYIGCLFLRQGL